MNGDHVPDKESSDDELAAKDRLIGELTRENKSLEIMVAEVKMVTEVCSSVPMDANS